MTSYSRMSYEQLRKIADDDSIADNIADEEYESLSVELWRKFSVEKGITGNDSPLAALSLRQENRYTVRSVLNTLRKRLHAAGT